MSEHTEGWYSRVEGPDGAGKSTVIKFAKAFAEEEKIDTLFIREPGTGAVGEAYRHLLLHADEFDFSSEEEYTIFTDNRRSIARDIVGPAVAAGKTVISDRGIESSVAMQGGEAGKITALEKGRTTWLSTEEILRIGQRELPLFYTRPNGLVLLSLSKEVRRARMAAKPGHDKIEKRTPEYSDAVHDGYIAQESLDYATVINAELSPEEVFRQARPVLFGHRYR